MNRVDAHHHVWDLAVRDQSWIDPDTMAPIRRSFGLDDLAGPAAAAGVTATVLVQTIPDPAETPEFLALAEGSDLVAGVVGWVDLTVSEVPEAIAALRAGPGGDWLVGVRHPVQSEPDPRWLCRPDVRRGLAAVADADLRFDLLIQAHQLPAAVETVGALPQLRFVLDHLAKPLITGGETEPWATGLAALAEHDNVAAKLSGLVTEADWQGWTVGELRPYTKIALDLFGPGRLMFGSDWPVCLLAASYSEVVAAAEELTAELTGAERAEVFGGTARRWYGIPGTARIAG